MVRDKLNSTIESAKDKIEDTAHSDGDVAELQMIADEMLGNLEAIDQNPNRDLDAPAVTALDRLRNVPQHQGASYTAVKQPLFEAGDKLKESMEIDFDEVRASKSFDLFP